jgi:antitoxin component YwqK of YwqJK toxin-antitoxin module
MFIAFLFLESCKLNTRDGIGKRYFDDNDLISEKGTFKNGILNGKGKTYYNNCLELLQLFRDGYSSKKLARMKIELQY